MSTGAVSDPEAIIAAVDRFEAAQAELAALSFNALSTPQALTVTNRLETIARRQGAVDHRLTQQLTTQASPVALGGKSWTDVLANRLRIGRSEARRRLDEAADLGPRTALSGEPLTPVLPTVAAAQAAGMIGAEHVHIIRRFFADLPTAVDYQTRQGCEATLARIASEHPQCVTQSRPAADGAGAPRRRLLRRRPGPPPRGDHRQPTSRRHEHDQRILGSRGPRHAGRHLRQMGRTWDVQPRHQTPCVDGTPSQAHLDNDQRSPPQRHHDALTAIGRSVLASGELGQHHGLPVTIIVSTTLQELHAGCGQAVTATGTLLPMPTVIKLASHAHHYLSVFDKHSGRPLYLARTRRIASADQRIVLYAKDRGCTRPGCTVAAANCQVHHAVDDWADNGQTNIDDLTLACPTDNRAVTPDGWTTRKRHDGRTEWIPPPHLDSGQSRVNDYHHPENYLLPDEGEEPAAD
jgi:hypothetical protein